jgi:hypothetical protein
VNVITENEDTVEQDEDDTFVVVESQVSVLTQEQVRILNHHLCQFILHICPSVAEKSLGFEKQVMVGFLPQSPW